jgi:hypothetical protein
MTSHVQRTFLAILIVMYLAVFCTSQKAHAEEAIKSVIVSKFNGLNYGNIYELQNGQIWKQTESYIWVWNWVRPKVIIYQDGGVYKMKVENIDHAVTVEPIAAIKSVIVSKFNGLDHGNIYELQNGQIWKQTEYYIWVWVWVGPTVLIYQDDKVYKMKVENIDHAVVVNRIK